MNNLKSISIVRIQPLSFQVDEGLEVKKSNDNVNVNFDIGYEFHEKGKVMSFNIGITFNEKEDRNIIFTSCTVKTFYKLEFENDDLIKERRVHIDKQSLVTMLSLSISHARAIMASNTNGTAYQNLIVPIINPTALFTDTLEKKLEKAIQEEYNLEVK